MHPTKKHLSEGEIRSYQDHNLSTADQARILAHLEGCPRCRLRAEEQSARSQRVQAHLSLLDPDLGKELTNTLPAARLRLANRLELEKEKPNMKTTIFGRLPRLAWASLILAGVLAIALTFEPVRVLANNFLSLFRVEQIRIVQVDDSKLPDQLQNSSQLEYIMSNDVQVDVQGESQKASTPEEASALAGFPLHLPAGEQGSQSFRIEPAAKMSFTVNLELVRGVLKDIGREDIQLPDSLDGAVVQMDIPTSVTALYGDCQLDYSTSDPTDPDAIAPDATAPAARGFKNCTTLIQVASPVVSAPPDLDLAQIGQAYLEVLGMDAQEAASFARNVNWTTTFVVPLPRSYASYEEVDVNGSAGTLVYERNGGHYSLLWIKDGTIYSLSGWGDKAAALAIANSIQ